MTNTRRPLMGLLSYSFLAAKNGLALIFGAASLMGIVAVVGITRWPMTVLIIPLMALLLMAGPILSIATNSDGASGWNRYQAAMPVTRGNLVATRYISILLGVLAATLVLLTLMAALLLTDEPKFQSLSESGQWVTSGVMVVAAPLLTAAVYLPLSSTKRTRSAAVASLLTCLIGAFAGAQFLYAGINRFIFGYGTTSSIVFWATIGASALILLASFLVTRYRYTRASF